MAEDNLKKKKRQWGAFVFVLAVTLALAACGTFIFAGADKTYSPSEKRLLAERPKWSGRRFLSGKFQREAEVFAGEQFPGRERLITVQTQVLRSLGKKDAAGVYFGADDYLLEQHRAQDFDWKQVRRNLKRTAAFLEKYQNARVMLVPSKTDVLSKKLPPFAQETCEQRFYREMDARIPKEQKIDVSGALKAHDDEYIYYRTDHHWTTLGAYYGYAAWAETLGITPLAQEDFSIERVSDDFYGTTFAKVRTGGRADEIFLYEPRLKSACTVEYNMGESRADGCYDRTKLTGEDPYSVFFGGNQAFIDIRMEHAKNDRTLFIVKDSFANCFVPFAANHYARVLVVDLRYVNIPVGKLLEIYPADDILILYNSVQFMDAKDISKLK